MTILEYNLHRVRISNAGRFFRAGGVFTGCSNSNFRGKVFAASGTITPQRSTEGRVVVIHDITELRRLEEVRGDFIANIPHELRTPTSVIKANVETLMESDLEGRPCALEFLETMQRNAERLPGIITNLLDISQIESGEYIVKPRAIQ